LIVGIEYLLNLLRGQRKKARRDEPQPSLVRRRSYLQESAPPTLPWDLVNVNEEKLSVLPVVKCRDGHGYPPAITKPG